ncbi:MAG TPA: hypothetical protein EYP85_06175, partial [Armatimonadetes bacterium]|nr:hypothetical protein [Armatimonadota bacterium]
SRLAYTSDREGINDLYFLDLTTRREQRVTQNLGNITHPTWSPSGAQLAFVSNRGGQHIWVVNVDGTGARQLTSGPSMESSPAWSPDGNKIAFVSNGRDLNQDGKIDSVGADFNIWVMDASGSNQTQITLHQAADQDPAWFGFAGSDPNQFLIFASNRDGNFDLFFTYADQPSNYAFPLSPPGNRTADVDPSPDPLQMENPRAAFSSRRGGNNDVFVLRFFDLLPPVLSDGRVPVLPQVSPRLAVAGGEVTIEATVYDGESGVAEVYALFKLPDQPIYVNTYAGTKNDVAVIGGDDYQLMVPREIDQMVVHARTYQLVNPREDIIRMLQGEEVDPLDFVREAGLQLFDDGPAGGHGDRRAGDGVYTNVWRTPPEPRDYYVDLVPVDNWGNFPFDFLANYHLWAGFGGNVVFTRGYDNVAGFSTKPFGGGSRILLVSDYTCGQKFLASNQFGQAPTDLMRYWPVAVPVERYYLEKPPPDIMAAPGESNLVLLYNPEGGNQYQLRPGSFVSGPSSEPPLGERYGWGLDEPVDVWRVLCRGSIDAATLNSYLPIPFTDPVSGETRYKADRMVVWASPYTGDLFVGPGTLLDPAMQTLLSQFLAQGGRLFTTGQNVAWALTINGTRPNSFLANGLRAQFVSDFSTDIITVPQQPLNRHRISGGDNATLPEEQFDTGLNPITQEAYRYHWRVTLYGNQGGTNTTDYYPTNLRLPGLEPGTNTDWAGDAAPNQWFVDDVLPINGAHSTINYQADGQSAGVRYIDPATGARSVYFAFGFEGIRNEFQRVTVDQVSWIVSRNHRLKLMTNISNYLRTGGIAGRVVGPDGQTALGGVVVLARYGLGLQNPVAGSAITLSDGTYLIEGLNAGLYTIDASNPGYTADHFPFLGVEGGQITRVSSADIRLLKQDEGVIAGMVTELDGVTAVPGATVTAVLEGTPQGAIPLTLTATSQADGSYIIQLVPAGTYTVTAEKPGYSSDSVAGVQVNPGQTTSGVDLRLAPGPGSISGTVVSAVGRRPVAGATVRVLLGQQEIGSAQTDQQGNYLVEDVPAGTYTLEVTAPGFLLKRVDNVVVQTAQETAGVDIVLDPLPPGEVVGRITNKADGSPVGGALVELLQDGQVIAVTTSANTYTTKDGLTFNYQLTNIPAGLYTIRVTASGFERRTRTLVEVREGRTTSEVNFELEPLHIFSRGLNMVSSPYDYTRVAPDIGKLIDDDDDPATPLRLAIYDPVRADYIFYPDPPAETFRLGQGYWIQLERAVALTREGFAASTGEPFVLSLQPGWNLIGNPFDFAVDWLKVRVRFNKQEMSLQEATSNGIVSNTLFTFIFGQYRMTFRLDPWTGYWTRAFQPAELLIPPEAAIPRSQEPIPPPRERVGRGEWQVELVARTDTGLEDRGNLLGMQTQASEGFDPLADVEEPPLAPKAGFLRLSFPHPEWGVAAGFYRADFRAPQPRRQTWVVEVVTDVPEAQVTLTWPGVAASLPPDLTLTLVDKATGARRSLRTTSHYTYRVGPNGGMRRFYLVAAPRSGSPLTISGLRTRRDRGPGITLQYVLSAEAQVTARIVTFGGRAVKTVAYQQPQAAGVQSVYWDGTDDAGRPVAAGQYLWEVRACTEEGEFAQRSIMVIRLR